MPDLDIDALVEQITKRVTSEVVAALSAQPAAPLEEWPEWNEYVDENGIMEEAAYMAALSGQLSPPTEPSPIPRHDVVPPPPPAGTSPLRARSRGIIPAPVAQGEEDEPYEVTPVNGAKGAVAPLSSAGSMGREVGGGFNPDPHANGDWFAAQFRKEVLFQRRQLPAEDQVTQVRI